MELTSNTPLIFKFAALSADSSEPQAATTGKAKSKPRSRGISKNSTSSSAVQLTPSVFYDSPQHSNQRDTTKERKYPCTMCDKRFTRPSSLACHKRTHTGEKPHMCKEPGCGKQFSVQSNLRRHMRIHEKAQASPSPADHCNSMTATAIAAEGDVAIAAMHNTDEQAADDWQRYETPPHVQQSMAPCRPSKDCLQPMSSVTMPNLPALEIAPISFNDIMWQHSHSASLLPMSAVTATGISSIFPPMTAPIISQQHVFQGMQRSHPRLTSPRSGLAGLVATPTTLVSDFCVWDKSAMPAYPSTFPSIVSDSYPIGTETQQ
ncbi:hypothetical protein GGF37_003392, partial [Kickxella alabastrina]